jgi:hypothetical protein
VPLQAAKPKNQPLERQRVIVPDFWLFQKTGKLFRNGWEKSGCFTREYGEKPIAKDTPRDVSDFYLSKSEKKSGKFRIIFLRSKISLWT